MHEETNIEIQLQQAFWQTLLKLFLVGIQYKFRQNNHPLNKTEFKYGLLDWRNCSIKSVLNVIMKTNLFIKAFGCLTPLWIVNGPYLRNIHFLKLQRGHFHHDMQQESTKYAENRILNERSELKQASFP